MCTPNGYQVLYDVRRGDTLLAIVHDQYGLYGAQARQVVDQILKDNPEIASPDLIYPGQPVLLRFPAGVGNAAIPIDQDLENAKSAWCQAPKAEQEEMADTSYVYRALGLGLTGGGAALKGMEDLLSSNIRPIEEIAESYNSYRQGKMTKGQYDYARKKAITAFKDRIGPAEKLLFGRKSANQALRMKPGGGVNATKPFISQVDKISKVSKHAARGGVILTGVSLAASCSQIARTPEPVAKDRIAVEALAGTAVGAGTGIAIGFFLVSNPVGWGVAIAIGVGTAAAGYFAGKGASVIYDRHFSEVRVVEVLKIDRVCR